jgi:hypothetical protein
VKPKPLLIAVAIVTTPFIYGLCLPLGAAWGLPPTLQAASAEFDRRIQAEYPPGTPEASIIRGLWWQGYGSPQQRCGTASDCAEAPKFVLAQSEMSLVCRSSWSVEWRADKNGKITSVKGGMNTVCL